MGLVIKLNNQIHNEIISKSKLIIILKMAGNSTIPIR